MSLAVPWPSQAGAWICKRYGVLLGALSAAGGLQLALWTFEGTLSLESALEDPSEAPRQLAEALTADTRWEAWSSIQPLHVLAVWCLVIYLPMLLCLYKDRDYHGLSLRVELFEARYSKASDGSSSQDAADLSVGCLGPLGYHDSFQGHEDSHLLTVATEPPLKDDVVEVMHRMLVANQSVGEKLKRHYTAETTRKLSASALRAHADDLRQLLHGALVAVRALRLAQQPRKVVEDMASNMPDINAVASHDVSVCHKLLMHQYLEMHRLQSLAQRSCWLRPFTQCRLQSLQRCHARYANSLNGRLKDMVAYQLLGVGVDATATPALPPLLALRMEVMDLPGAPAGSPMESLVPGTQVFVWIRHAGELLVHTAEPGHRGLWVLARGDGEKSIAVPLAHDDQGQPAVQVWWEAVLDEDGDDNAFANGGAGTGRGSVRLHARAQDGSLLSLRVAELHGSGSLGLLERWADDLADPALLQRAVRVNVMQGEQGSDMVISLGASLDELGCETRPRRALRQQSQSSGSLCSCGLVLSTVKADGRGHFLGLRAGMELVCVNDERTSRLPYEDILKSLEKLTTQSEFVFRRPAEPDAYVVVDQAGAKGTLGFTCRGLVVESVTDTTRACGLRPKDEIVVINGESCYHSLGDQSKAEGLLRDAARHVPVSLGVRRLGCGKVPKRFERLLELPSVFRYAPVSELPHTAAYPFVLGSPVLAGGDGDEDEPVHCAVWMSHGGMVLSLQPLGFDFCIGIYVRDVVGVTCWSFGVRAMLGKKTKQKGTDAHLDLQGEKMTPAMLLSYEGDMEYLEEDRVGPDEDILDDRLAVLDPTTEVQGLEDFQCPVPTLIGSQSLQHSITPRAVKPTVKQRLSRDAGLSSGNEDVPASPRGARQLAPVGSHSATPPQCAIFDADESVAVQQRPKLPVVLRLQPPSPGGEIEESRIVLVASAKWMQKLLTLRVRQACKAVYGEQSGVERSDSWGSLGSLRSSGSLGSTGSMASLALEENMMDFKVEEVQTGPQLLHSDALAAWRKATLRELDPEQNAAIAKCAREIAGRLLYQLWSPIELFCFHLWRWHGVAQVMGKNPHITRSERFAVLCTALQASALTLMVFFPADCAAAASEQHEAACMQSASWTDVFIPTWSTTVFSVVVLTLVAPVQYMLICLFWKAAIQEKLSAAEKDAHIMRWRFRNIVTWISVVCGNAVCTYWLASTFEAGTYSHQAYARWGNAAIQALLHRLITLPCLCAIVITLVVLISKTNSCVDGMLVRWHTQLLPGGRLREPPPVSPEDLVKQAQAKAAADVAGGGIDNEASAAAAVQEEPAAVHVDVERASIDPSVDSRAATDGETAAQEGCSGERSADG
eukprot:TRINITY_DN27810_c0_g4_i1.p1 TRINITY_DN27810_c0_g4~~TRINITY_DN27810_c0_g4_i1.p1  ORF type:complete len:1373 (-),score=193.83 TRINITY_DN27810_c0_g4_i1:367-4419(-)